MKVPGIWHQKPWENLEFGIRKKKVGTLCRDKTGKRLKKDKTNKRQVKTESWKRWNGIAQKIKWKTPMSTYWPKYKIVRSIAKREEYIPNIKLSDFFFIDQVSA